MMGAPAQISHKPSNGGQEDDDSSEHDHHRDDGERVEEDEQPGSDGDDDDDGAQDNDVARRYNLPMSHEVALVSHSKAVACIAVDAPGSRVATGSMD
jgi:hypothetical protein